MAKDEIGALAAQLERDLTAQFGGPLISGSEAVSKVLGYPTPAAFRQAMSVGKVPIHVFSIEGRRGKFALVKDVAAWLAFERTKDAARGNSTNGDEND